MKKGKVFFLVLFFSFIQSAIHNPQFVTIYANGIPPTIEHYPVQEAQEGVGLTISAIITDEDGVKSASIYFRTLQQPTYQQVIMTSSTPSGGVFSAAVEGISIISPYLEYYIEAQDVIGNKSFSPKASYLTKPYYVKINTLSTIEKLKPSGNYSIFFRDASGKYSDLQPIPPGSILNFNLNTTASGGGRNYSFWLNRDTEQYTVRTQNRFKLGINTKKTSFVAGDFHSNFSELSFPGVEIRRGISVKSNLPKNKYYLVAGHSQIDIEKTQKLSPIYRQYFVGLRQEVNLSKKTFLALHSTYSKDDENSIAAGSGLLGVKDITSSAEIKHSFYENINFSTEYALNKHSLSDGAKMDDSAYQVKFETAIKKLDLTTSYKNIGADFFTTGTLSGITTTNKKGSMDNNKKGIFNSFEFRPMELISLSGTFDDYKQLSPDGNNNYLIETEDRKIGVNLMPKNIPNVSIRVGKLTRDRSTGGNESTSKSTGYGTNYTLSDLGPLANVRLTYNKMEIDYTSTPLTTPSTNLKINMDIIGLESAYKNILVLSGNINKTKTKDLNATTTTKRDNLTLGLNWNAVPDKFTLQTGIQDIKNKKSDGNINNDERNYTLQANYYLTRTLILSAIGKKIEYEDNFDKVNNYDEDIITVRVAQNFWEIAPKQKTKVAKEKEITKVEKVKPVEEVAEVEETKPVEEVAKEEKPITEEKIEKEVEKIERIVEEIEEIEEEIEEEEIEEIEPKKEVEKVWTPPRKRIIAMKKGETFQEIAKRYYGDERKYLQIILDNPQVFVYVYILPGEKIKITTKKDKQITYIVKPKDTLFRIAKRYLGEGELFVEILRQNPQIKNVYTKPGVKVKVILE